MFLERAELRKLVKLRGSWRLRAFLCLILSTIYACRTAEASIEAAALREDAFSKLLFWSSYDFSLDAATQLIGPLDVVVRGGADFHVDEALYTIEAEEEPVETNHTDFREEIIYSQKERGVFSLFQNGDGSESDPDGIPIRYMRMQDNNRLRAAKALEATLQWRKDNDIDHLLLKPQAKFDVCKKVFPHYFVGRDKGNHVVFVQRPAKIDLDLAKRNKLTNDDLLMHYIYVNEYLWQVLEASSPLGTMVSVLDLSGLDLSLLKKSELIGFIKKFVSTMDAHFPQRSHKTLILNAPKWFNVLYKMFSPLLRESTKAKIEILSRGKKQDDAMKRCLGDQVAEAMPATFWSRQHNKAKNGGGPEPESDEPEAEDREVENHRKGKKRKRDEPEPEVEVNLDELPLERELRSYVSCRRR